MSGMYDPSTGMTFNSNRQHNDARLLVRFYIDPQQNASKSAAQGRPIFDDVEMVEIIMAGDKRTMVTERVKDHHRERFADTYRAFKEGREEAQSGTPLEQWPPLTPSQVAEFKALNIKSVEALAAVSDANLDQLGMGARTIREKAALWLQQAKDGSAVTDLQRKNETLQDELEILKRTVADLKSTPSAKETT